MPFPCRAHAVPQPCHAAMGLDCLSLLNYTTRLCLIHTWHAAPIPRLCHATTMPFWKRLLKSTAQRSMGMVWYVWIGIGRPETACGWPGRFWLLPVTTRSFTKVVIRSIPIPHSHSEAGRIVLMNNSNDFIGNQTRDLPSCSAVPQSTAPLRTTFNLCDDASIITFSWCAEYVEKER
jgi:hypothetical protein